MWSEGKDAIATIVKITMEGFNYSRRELGMEDELQKKRDEGERLLDLLVRCEVRIENEVIVGSWLFM